MQKLNIFHLKLQLGTDTVSLYNLLFIVKVIILILFLNTLLIASVGVSNLLKCNNLLFMRYILNPTQPHFSNSSKNHNGVSENRAQAIDYSKKAI